MTAAKPPAENAHPLLKFIYQELKIEDRSLRSLCSEAGVSYNTVKQALQNCSNISLRSTEDLLNVLGYTMKPTSLIARGQPAKVQGGREKDKALRGRLA